MGNDESAQTVMDLVRINHNYCRPHSGLPNSITPAEAAGIDLKLENNKLKGLIEKSAEAKIHEKREYQLEPQLGKRVDYVDIRREADCVSVKPKGWIPKPVWREINDILFINGFSWLEDGKESKRIRLKQQSLPS